MAKAETKYSELYKPTTISRDGYTDICDFLLQIKQSLPMMERILKAQVWSPGEYTSLSDAEARNAIDDHALSKVTNIQISLVLKQDTDQHCDINILFDSRKVFVYVLDTDTGWGASIKEEVCHYLESKKIARPDRLAQVFTVFDHFQFTIMLIGAVTFLIGYVDKSAGFIWGGASVFIAGLIPTLRDARKLVPDYMQQAVIRENPAAAGVPLAKIAIIVSIVAGLWGIGKDLIKLILQSP